MSQELERVYTINLGKVLLSANTRRSTRAINMIREFARHHMKTENVKIDEDLAHEIWKRGIRHPPRKIRVRMTKTDDRSVLISLYEEETETKEEPEAKEAKLKQKVKEEVKPQVETKQVSEKIEEEKPKIPAAKEEKPTKPAAKEEKPKIPAAKEEKPKKPAVKEEKPKIPAAKEEKPKKSKLASFVDQKKDPQHYIDRYNKEKKYKAWFDKNYPNLTIEEAVGLKPSTVKEEKPTKPAAKEEKPKKKSS